MNILIPVSVVSDPFTRVTIDNQNDSLDIPRSSLVLNPLDLQVLSRALAIFTGQAITVITVGRKDTEDALRIAYAIGAQNVVRINEEPLDAHCTAHSIAEYMTDKKFDLVLCGIFSWDFSSGQTARRLAIQTGLPLYENVSEVQIDLDELKFSVQAENNIKKYRATTAVILSCNKSVFPSSQVRIPSFRQMITARSKSIEIVRAKPVEPLNVYHRFEYVEQRSAVKFFEEKDLSELVDIILKANLSEEYSNTPGRHTIFSGTITAEIHGVLLCSQDSSQGAQMISEQKVEKHISLTNSRVVISGGTGVNPDAWKLIDSIADKLKIATGCSRPVYESGLRPYYQHVGQTGQSIAPELYIAVGISGALQHIAGVVNSKKILAINSDPKAEIFKNADYAVIGDAQKILSDILEIISKLPLPTQN